MAYRIVGKLSVYESLICLLFGGGGAFRIPYRRDEALRRSESELGLVIAVRIAITTVINHVAYGNGDDVATRNLSPMHEPQTELAYV